MIIELLRLQVWTSSKLINNTRLFSTVIYQFMFLLEYKNQLLHLVINIYYLLFSSVWLWMTLCCDYYLSLPDYQWAGMPSDMIAGHLSFFFFKIPVLDSFLYWIVFFLLIFTEVFFHALFLFFSYIVLHKYLRCFWLNSSDIL